MRSQAALWGHRLAVKKACQAVHSDRARESELNVNRKLLEHMRKLQSQGQNPTRCTPEPQTPAPWVARHQRPRWVPGLVVRVLGLGFGVIWGLGLGYSRVGFRV